MQMRSMNNSSIQTPRIRLSWAERKTMTQPRKMSEIMKEMSERLLKKPDAVHSSEAAHVALMFANIAWNETVGLVPARKGYRSAWESIEAENPEMWSEFKSKITRTIDGGFSPAASRTARFVWNG
jgi:hypothetical protein